MAPILEERMAANAMRVQDAAKQQADKASEEYRKFTSQRQNRAYVKSALCILLSLGSITLLIMASNLMCSRLEGLKMPLFRTMHMAHKSPGAAPTRIRSWNSLDWIMQPSLTHTDTYSADIPDGRTTDDTHYTGVQAWQRADTCPPPQYDETAWETSVSLPHPAKMLLQFFCDPENTDHKLCPMDKSGKVFYPNPLMYYACRTSRAPTLAVFENDAHGWSFAASHSPVTLVFFMQMITLVIALYQAIRWYWVWNKTKVYDEKKSADDTKNQLREHAGMLTSLLIALLVLLAVWILLVRFNTSSLENMKSGDKLTTATTLYDKLNTRPLPNGSYLYGIFFFLLASFTSVSHLQKLLESAYGQHMYNDLLIDDDSDEMTPVTERALVPFVPTGAGEAMKQMTRSRSAAAPAELNVLGFVDSKKISINAYQHDKGEFGNADHKLEKFRHRNNDEGGIVRILLAPRFKQSMWSIAQVCLLPLWTLTALSIAQGYEVDVNTQLVVLCSFVIGVSDLYLDRMTTMVHACNILQKDMLFGVETWIAGIVIAVQIFLAFLINFGTGWRASSYALQGSVLTMRANDATFGTDDTRSLNSTGIWLFNIYFGIAVVLKIGKTWFRNTAHEKVSDQDRKDDYWSKKSWFSIRTLDELLLFTLLAAIWLYSIIVLTTLNNSGSWFSSLKTTFGSDVYGVTSEEMKALFWQSDWTEMHAR